MSNGYGLQDWDWQFLINGNAFSITANGFALVLEFYIDSGIWKGVMGTDTLVSVNFVPDFTYVSFTRNLADTGIQQFYQGGLDYSRLSFERKVVQFKYSGIFTEPAATGNATYFWTTNYLKLEDPFSEPNP